MNTNERAAAENILKDYPDAEAPVATFSRGILSKTNTKLLSVTTLGQLAVNDGPLLLSGAGAPAIIAPLGSIYMRTDGSTSTSIYIKTADPTATTGWTAK
jgi:hypothetical protein